MANNRWTNFVREWAVKNGLSYGCALSDPAMREEYKVKYGNRKRLTQTKEKEMMGQEDKDAIELVIEEVAPKKGKKGRPAKYATAEEARQAKIKNTIEARKRKKQGQKELGLEAKEAEMMGKEDINRARKKVMRPPSSPPPISAEMVQRAKAKKDNFDPFGAIPQRGMFQAFVERSKSGKGFNPLPEFAEQVKGAESGGGIQHLPDGCVLYTGGSPLDRQIGGHWTEQMKPHLEKELRNYQNIVHHLGQHLSESGQKDPKDAMGYSHYGNEMRRIKQLLSTI